MSRTNGKHVKTSRGIDSRTPRGPERWARAAHNALTNPLSQAAELYFRRVETARYFIDFDEAASPFEHVDDWYEPNFNTIVESKRRYVTCNIVCAAMQVQLDFGTTNRADVRRILDGSYRRTYVSRGQVRYAYSQVNAFVLDRRNLTRTVRCQVCGTDVKPERA